MKAKDMREKPLEDLRELEKSLAHDHFQAKLKNFTNRLDDTSSMRKLRKDMARVKTLIGELARGKAKSEPKAAPVPQAPKKAAPKAPKAKAAAIPPAAPSSKSAVTKPAESKPAKAPAKKTKAAPKAKDEK